MKKQNTTKELSLLTLITCIGTVFLTACGEEQASYTAADEARVKEMSMSGCAQMGGEEAVCECVFDKMKANLSKEDFSTWVKLMVAVDGATTVQEAVEKTGMSEAELRKANAQYAGEGARAGMECEAELAQ